MPDYRYLTTLLDRGAVGRARRGDRCLELSQLRLLLLLEIATLLLERLLLLTDTRDRIVMIGPGSIERLLGLVEFRARRARPQSGRGLRLCLRPGRRRWHVRSSGAARNRPPGGVPLLRTRASAWRWPLVIARRGRRCDVGWRIRDEIAASKAKGMWIGGVPPLGYNVRDRKLVVNDAEAATVRHIMERYVALGSGCALIDELRAGPHRTKLHGGRGACHSDWAAFTM